MNSPHTIGVLALVVWGIVLLGLLVVTVREHARKIKIHRNDRRIFKSAEEARRDFS